MAYQPRNLSAYMETPDVPTQLRELYQERVCIENAFSTATMTSMFDQLRNAQPCRLLPQTVETGGGRNGVRFPDVSAFRGNHAIATIRDNNQFKLSGSIGGTQALQEVQHYYDEHPDAFGNRPTNVNQVNVSLANFMWRYTHRNVNGSYPLIVETAEISHRAEGYSAANAGWTNAKVELTELESADVNESRKTCTVWGLMWRKPDFSLIEPEEDYAGPTLCPHAAVGSPCYAPYPAVIVGPTGGTPNPRKARRKTDGDGKGKKVKRTTMPSAKV